MSAPSIDINDYQQLFYNKEEAKACEFDFNQVWENMDTSALSSNNLDPLSALMGEITPIVGESPMMSTPYLDSCLNTPFTPATVFTPSLNQFQNSPYYSPYIESNVYNQFGIDPQDIQVANYLHNDMKEPANTQETSMTTNSLFGSVHCPPSQVLDAESDFLFPPLTSDQQQDKQEEKFNFNEDLFEIDDSLFNLIEPVMPPTTITTTKKRKVDEKIKPNKRIKIDAKQKHACPQCSATFDRRYNLGTHIKTHDKNRKKDFECRLCAKTFDRKHDLTRHVSTVHNGERAFTCESCSSTFSRKDAMVRHKVQKHGYQV